MYHGHGGDQKLSWSFHVVLLGLLWLVAMLLGWGRAFTFQCALSVWIRSLIIVNSRTIFVEYCCVSCICQFWYTDSECSPGTMFISWADCRRLCLSSIFFVAFPVHPSGNINVFLEDCPVSIRSGCPLLGLLLRSLPSLWKQTALTSYFVVFVPNAPLPYWVGFQWRLLTWPSQCWCDILILVPPVLQLDRRAGTSN